MTASPHALFCDWLVIATPLFTLEFRRKMAELPQAARREWLESLASKVRSARSGGGAPLLLPLEAELREVARGCRLPLVDAIDKQLGPFDPRHLSALLEVPRERFVRDEDIERSADDTPLALDDEGMATISAPHAYLLSFRLLSLSPGDSLVELGTGSGYGAALAAFIVGSDGRVLTFEIDRALAEWSRRTLAEQRNVRVMHDDAVECAASWGQAKKIVCTFAVDSLSPAWLSALGEGTTLVAPVGQRDRDQRLVRVVRKGGQLCETDHGAVRYVKNRSPR